jgi:serine/threonine-protein kinase
MARQDRESVIGLEFVMALRLEAGAEPIAGYTLVRLLGRGGFGEVWEATAPGSIPVALKFIRLDTVEAGSEQRALEVLRNIRHPHLLDVQFARRVEDCLVIAMPLCDQSLMDRLQACKEQGQPGLPRDELLGYMEDLARAVDFLNEPRHLAADGSRVGVQHRDIKPHNIFLVGGSVRLADFGVAKMVEARDASHTGAMSPHYVPPEMIEGRVTQWSDQYSLAVTYCQLRTGALPYAFKALNQLLYAHLYHAPNLSVLPEKERQVVLRALAKRAEDRWPNCRALAAALKESALHDDGRLLAPAPGSTSVTVSVSGPAEPTTENEGGRGTLFTEAPAVPTAPRWNRRPRRRARGLGLAALATSVAGLLVGVLLFPRFQAAKDFLKPEPARARQGGIADTPAAPSFGASRTSPRLPVEPVPQPAPGSESAPTPAPTTDPELAQHARQILKTYCYRCHGVRFEVPGYDVLDRDVLVARRGEDEPTYVVPGQPEASYLWERVGVDRDMPPSGPKPSEAQRAVIARWIKAGAPFPQVAMSARPRWTEHEVLAAIRDHLRQAHPGDRPYLRYFTFHNLYDNPRVDDADLRLARAAVAKLVNSLSWKPEIVVPAPIDHDQVVLAFDLRDVGWDVRGLWDQVLTRYPYGLKYDKDPDPALRALATEVDDQTGAALSCVRADWFVATASRPRLYTILLDLPEYDHLLERQLKVDVAADFLNDKLARAGFASSGVSSQNRLVERHPALYGAYWKSYDFTSNDGTANLFRYPLGPVFAGNPYAHQAFEHAGGEILFNLPNGLQAYLLVDAAGRRIDAGPVEVVSDALKTSGTATIVTGLSCMACHRQGTIAVKNTVRDGLAVAGAPRDKVERLYPAQPTLDRILARDESRFVKALDEATGDFLKLGEDRATPIGNFPEPIGAVARAYLKDLGPDEVAADLGFNDAKELTARIQASARLREFGLAPLLSNAPIKRTEWDAIDGRFLSRFQEVAHELELGTPFRSFD